MKARTLLVVFAVLLAGIAGGVMAVEPTLDTDDTDAHGVTDIEPNDVLTYNESEDAALQWDADTENTAVYIDHVDEDGDVIEEDVYVDEDPTVVDETDGIYNSTVALDGSDFDAVYPDAGEEVHLNATIVNDQTLDEPDELHVEFSWVNTEEQSSFGLTDAVADSSDTEFLSAGILSSINVFSDDPVDPFTTEFEMGVTENTTTLTVDAKNESAADANAEALDGADDGDWLPSASVKMNDEFVPVFAEEQDSEWVDDDEDTYAVLTDDGDTVEIHNADDRIGEGDETVDVELTANENMGMTNAASMLQDYGEGTASAYWSSMSAMNIPFL